MTVSTLTVVPEAPASGTAPCAEPTPNLFSTTVPGGLDARLEALARAARPDYPAWLDHIRSAAGCARPIRLAGQTVTLDAATGRLLSSVDSAELPDGIVYKACGNRRASACPTCSRRYQRDAYEVIRTGLIGGKGVPATVAAHPAVFPTLTAPSFGPVHTRYIKRHTCTSRRRCDCRPEPCHARRDLTVCAHGVRLVCYARHPAEDRGLGTPLCLDCYDHDGQAVWNLYAGELWRRTRIALERFLRRRAKTRGIDPARLTLSYGKAAEMQRRAVIHFHALIRLDGVDLARPGAIVPPPAGLDAADLVDAVEHAARSTAFHTPPHLDRPAGWRIGWGEQNLTRILTVAGHGDVTDAMVAAYLAKYATKSTEITGHVCPRLTSDTVDLYADPDGEHTARLVDACWRLGRPTRIPTPLRDRPARPKSVAGLRPPWTCPRCRTVTRLAVCVTCSPSRPALPQPPPAVDPFRRLRLWAHMLGYGGHFLTKSRRYSITFALLRQQRIVFRRTVHTGPEAETQAPQAETTLVVNFLQYVGAGWHTTGDALLAQAAAAHAREHEPSTHDVPTATAA